MIQRYSVKDNDSTDTKTVYVGGIPFYSSEDDIMNFFRDCGTISGAVYKTFPDTGKFRGIALITFKVGSRYSIIIESLLK
jgi:nucleolin